MPWSTRVVDTTKAALEPLACPENARAMQKYMKDVAPFLGIKATDLRRAIREAWKSLPAPEPAELCAAAVRFWELEPREYHYSGAELLGKHVSSIPADELDRTVRQVLTTEPWWDTVDLLGSKVVTPMVAGDQDLVAVMWDWNASGDRWLVRASIQHQRGRKQRTDVPRLIAMCEPHAYDREFFVAKAIGWAMRDLCRVDPSAVASFATAHPGMPAVARREIDRGLARVP